MARKLSAIRADIRAQWPAIVERARVRPEALDALPKAPSLLGSGTKTVKGEAFGYLTAVVYMSPANEAFAEGDTRTLCPFATKGCASACLGAKAGRMIMRPVRASRLWKATLYMGARQLWRELAHAEVEAFERKARRAGLLPVVRIDGSTDTGEGERIAATHPGVTFYDYTKNVERALRPVSAGNYSVTFSASGENWADVFKVLQAGGHVAVVFGTGKGQALPRSWQGFKVIDGDVSDLRFADPKGPTVVGLRFKAASDRATALAAAERAGFVVPHVEAA